MQLHNHTCVGGSQNYKGGADQLCLQKNAATAGWTLWGSGGWVMATLLNNALEVELVEALAPCLGQAGGLVGAEEAPVLIGLDAAHEQVVDPQTVEQVAGTGLLLACVDGQGGGENGRMGGRRRG